MESNEYSYKWLSLIGLSLLAFTAFLDFTIVSTAMPFIQASFNASVLQLQWVSSIFAMVLAMFMICAGKLGDMYDRRVIFYAGFVFFGVAAVGAALSSTIQWLIAFRALQGLGGAVIFTQSAALLPQAFPPNEQARAVSIYSSITGFGLAIGPLLGGIIITGLGWRYIFWINIPIIVVGLLCCAFTLRPQAPQTKQPRFDGLGLIFLIIAIGATIYGLILGEQIGWDSRRTDIYLAVGVLAIISLLVQERRHPEPLLDLNTFCNPYALLAIFTCVCAGILTNVFLFFDPLYFKIIRHYDAGMIGLILMAMPICQVLVALLFPSLIKNIHLTHLMIIGIAFSILGAFLNSWFNFSFPLWVIIITLGCMGATWGIANTSSISIINSHFTERESGTILGTIFTCWNIAGAAFLAISTVVFNQFQTGHLTHYLKQNPGDLSVSDQGHLMKALKDPDHAASHLHNSSSSLHHLYGIFQEGFTYAMRNMSWIMTVLLIIILIAGLIQVKRVSD